MKWMCVILMLSDTGMPLERSYKPFESLSVCEAWKYQQSFAPAVRPPLGQTAAYYCEPYWEA